MGCCAGKEKSSQEEEALNQTDSTTSSDVQRPPVDRRLLIISDQDGGVVGRLPGQLNGRQFKIYDCKNCTILVLDYTSTITVDNCTGCEIFIAPSKGSVYLRDCVDCQCMVACQQFRMKNCKKCSVSLYTATQPVMESSTKIKFACLQCYYPQMKAQFESAGLSEFNNRWSVIHDFDRGVGDDNWSLLNEENPVIITLPTEGELADVGITFDRETSVVPYTLGIKQKPEGELCLVVFFESDKFEETVHNFKKQLIGKAQLVVTKKAKLQDHEAGRLFPDNEVIASMTTNGDVIFMEVCGTNSTTVCKELLSSLSPDESSWYVSADSDQGRKESEAFENFTESGFSM